MSKNIYLQYRQEREDLQSIEVEGAFATYKFTGEYCYLEDIYTIPELRGSKISYELATMVESAAKKSGYNKMLGSVDINAVNPEISLKACFTQGYKILKLEGSVIWLSKEI